MPNKTETEWRGGTLVFVDSVWSDIQTLAMQAKFAAEESGDQGLRQQFCYVLAHLESVKGLSGWKPVDETATPDEFRKCYKGLMSTLDDVDEFMALVRAVNEMKAPRSDALDKPDAALTEDEEADPN